MAIILRIVVIEALFAAILFAAAGRVDLPWFWAVLVVHATLFAVGMSLIDPELREERMRPGPGGTSRRVRFLALPMVVAHLAVAGLDVGRFGWSGPMPVALQGAALVAYAAGSAFSIWAMAANRFFSPVVRIQAERGHHVITAGPYRWMRHPGYAGMLVGVLCGGVALGSWWSLVPMVPFVGLFLHRTALEDRFLRDGLEGYAGYARRVRHRLVPGLW